MAPTIRPAAYPELEAEIYLAMTDLDERETTMPPAGELAELLEETK